MINERAARMQLKRVAIDTSKHVFTLHSVDDSEHPVLRKRSDASGLSLLRQAPRHAIGRGKDCRPTGKQHYPKTSGATGRPTHPGGQRLARPCNRVWFGRCQGAMQSPRRLPTDVSSTARGTAAKRFFRSARATMGFAPDRVTTDGHGSYQQITDDVGISESTVKVHRSHLTRRMITRSLAELGRMADQLKAVVGGPE